MNDYADREGCYLFVAMTELTLGQTDRHFSFHSIRRLRQRYTYILIICSVERKLDTEKYIA